MLFESLNTTAIVNNSGPPPEGGTPIAAVSRMLLSTPLHMRSISTELTCPNKQHEMIEHTNKVECLNFSETLYTEKDN